ncbi:MAG: type II secretion system protein GspJ [Thermodesulfobacteriota bacterium]
MFAGITVFERAPKDLVSVRDERGFTLIETILSLSILVIMIGLVLSSVRLGQKSWLKGEAAVEDAGARRFVISRLEADIASMYPYKENMRGIDTYFFKGEEKEFAFVTVHHNVSPGLPWGGAAYVSYTAGSDGLIIREKTVPFAAEALNQAERVLKADPLIKSVTFSYLGENGWSDEWNMAAIKSLPLAVKVKFIYRKDDKSPLLITMPVAVTYDPSAEYYEKRTGA